MATNTLGNGLMTTSEAARLLSVHENTVRRWCDLGILKSYRVTLRGDRRVSVDSVEALVSRMHDNNGYV